MPRNTSYLALQAEEHGDPWDVLQLRELQLPQSGPGPGEAAVNMLAVSCAVLRDCLT